MYGLWLRCLCLTVCLTVSWSNITRRVSLNDFGHFVDDAGRRMLFHGYNNVWKSPPYYDQQALNLTRLDMFQEWGFNVVRLGVIWSAVYPQRDVVNETYLRVIETMIDRFSKRGIYVLLDMHQDVMSSRFGTYDGVPIWLLESFSKVPKTVDYPWPLSSVPTEQDWFKGYLTLACQHAYQQLYSNSSGAWRYWGDYWELLAKRFRKNPAILGYELINEPFAGNIFTNPMRALPGYAGERNLMPVYNYLVKRIRAVDKQTLIFYEPVTWGVFFPPLKKWLGTGFDRVPGALVDPTESKRSVLSYHYYCWPLQTVDPSIQMPVWEQVFCDNVLLESVYSNSLKAVQKTGGGRFLTEFGLCAPDGDPRSINTIECNAIMRLADQYLQSWTYWDSMFFDKNGNPIDTQLRSFGRVYPQATRGNLVELRFDPTSSNAFISFIAFPITSEAAALGETLIAEVFVPRKIHYRSGQSVHTEPNNVTTQLKGNILLVYAPPEGFKQMTNVIVEIKPLN